MKENRDVSSSHSINKWGFVVCNVFYLFFYYSLLLVCRLPISEVYSHTELRNFFWKTIYAKGF